jgi:hypothetical protein
LEYNTPQNVSKGIFLPFLPKNQEVHLPSKDFFGMLIGNFLRRLALPKSINEWSLRTMREKLVKIGAKVVSHARYVTFQMPEVLVSRSLFREILESIHRLKPVPIGYD